MKKGQNVQVYFNGLQPDQRAYIYQQINEFTPFFLPDSGIEVLVAKDKENKENPYSVTFVLTGGGTFVQSEGRASNIYEAVKEAKNKLLSHLHAIQQDVVSSDEREREIELLKKFGGKLH
ncbi:MAG: hypothetical protein D6797_02095 [Bdellovibrio sp.]|nr:MAG: hypothetical protein D6797_02095 [Bdellovibrio sp.]